MTTATTEAEGARCSTRFIDKALDVAAEMTRGHGGHRWAVIGVRPNGVILEKRAFGRTLRRYVHAASTGAL